MTVCVGCGVEGKVQRLEIAEHVQVRHLTVPVIKILRQCVGCQQQWENSQDPDWRLCAYEQFREISGYKTPQQIQQWRLDLGVSPEDMSLKMGWAPHTWARYERGALQTAHDNQLLCDLMDGAPSGSDIKNC